MRWAAWRRRSRSRTIRPPTRRRMEKVRADKVREAATATTAPGSRIPGWCRSPRKSSTRHAGAEPDRAQAPGRECHRRRSARRARRRRSPKRDCAQNVDVGLRYLEAWLRGNGCVPLYNLMEDAATAEISRAQVWQWVRPQGEAAGRAAGRSSARAQGARRGAAEAQGDVRRGGVGEGPVQGGGLQLFLLLIEAPQFPEWLTVPAYEKIIAEGA